MDDLMAFTLCYEGQTNTQVGKKKKKMGVK